MHSISFLSKRLLRKRGSAFFLPSLNLNLKPRFLLPPHHSTFLPQSKLRAKDPNTQYAALEAAGASVVFADPSDAAVVKDVFAKSSPEVVYDNNGKDIAACGALIDAAEASGNRIKHYCFVGSAGAYADNYVEPQLFEGMTRKPKAPHFGVEARLEASELPYTVFQPLYIYGAHTNKDCEQWFLDRIVRGRPVPIPSPGVQLVSLSHVDDLAAAMAAVVGTEGAKRQHLNICSDRAITLAGIVSTLAKAAGVEAEVVLYDPKSVQLEKGEGFPFRTGHFFASAEKAKRVLDWKPEHTFLGDAAERVAAYRASGRDKKEMAFPGDDKILAAVKKVAAVAA